MTEPRQESVQCMSPSGLHRMAYVEWGDPDNDRVLVCVHGLTRVSRDFDEMARALCDTYRVVCPDVAGRGRSDWLKDPRFYQVSQYVSDMVTLVARLNVRQVHWFGTSMGGLIGMGLASLPETPISRLVLNDVGPRINAGALARIGEYLGKPIDFDSFDRAVDYVSTISASFGPHSRGQWERLTRYVVRQDGARWIMHYDPSIAVPFKSVTPEDAAVGEAALWRAYDAIRCPTLLVRGALSDLLSRDTAGEMTRRGPRARLVEIAGVGHAPTFIHDDQIALACNFLLEKDAR